MFVELRSAITFRSQCVWVPHEAEFAALPQPRLTAYSVRGAAPPVHRPRLDHHCTARGLFQRATGRAPYIMQYRAHVG